VRKLLGVIDIGENGVLTFIVTVIPVERASIATKELVYIVTPKEEVGWKLIGFVNPTIVKDDEANAPEARVELTTSETFITLLETSAQVTGVVTETKQDIEPTVIDEGTDICKIDPGDKVLVLLIVRV
jgi:hypothetical protein